MALCVEVAEKESYVEKHNKEKHLSNQFPIKLEE